MQLILFALAVLAFGGVCALVTRRNRIACWVGGLTAIVGSLLALYPTLMVLLTPTQPLFFATTAFTLPIGQTLLHLDSLSALFLLPTLLVAPLCALYGQGSLARLTVEKKSGPHWFFYNFLIIGLILTFTAADAFLFMISWEVMSLAPFFLLIFYAERSHVRYGGWAYLIAAHLGALFLLAFFIALSAENGGALDFATFIATGPTRTGTGMLFLLAFIGFGIKAGLMPLHVWLPETYPAAPTHVSGIMAGAVSTTGIYGIMRSLTFLGTSDPWWAYTLMGVGAFSAILGVLLACSQKSIKRTLAYSSIENMGIICMALGFSLFATQQGTPHLALLCALGAMLHMSNHSLYKSLLFLTAGNLARKTGTDMLNELGGIQKKAPLLGIFFFIGAASICALPPFNGFAGEFVMYLSFAFGGSASAATGFIYWSGLFVLACASGMSLLCFTRVYGIAFLGVPRKPLPEPADPTRFEKHSLLLLSGLCVVFALAAPYLAQVFINALAPYFDVLHKSYTPQSLQFATDLPALRASIQLALPNFYHALGRITQIFVLFGAIIFALVLVRKYLLKNREVTISPTWDCGYAKPTPKIQYTGGSFVQAAAYFMRFFLRPHAVFTHFTSYFPRNGKARLEAQDWVNTLVYTRVFRFIARLSHWFKGMQHGKVNTYILYILATLVTLLAWKIQ